MTSSRDAGSDDTATLRRFDRAAGALAHFGDANRPRVFLASQCAATR